MTLLRFTTILIVCGLSLLNSGCDRVAIPEFTVAPEILPNPNPDVPLAGVVTAETDQPTRLDIQVTDGPQSWSVPTSPEYATNHLLTILGFKPDRRHTITVTASNETGDVSISHTLEFLSPPLPEDFPKIEVLVSNPEAMESGITLFALMRWPDGASEDQSYGLAIAVDAAGDVIWYRTGDRAFEDPHRVANGTLLGILGHNRAEEVDMLGNVVTSWHASEHPDAEANALVPEGSIPVATETLHHDIQEMPSGNLLVLSTEVRLFEDYPATLDGAQSQLAPANVVGDVIVEFSRDGSIVNEWKLLDLLDPQRLGHESLSDIWDVWAYTDVEGGTKDWSHANSVFYQAATDSILVSLRHQEAVISFSRETGELNWILGAHEGWREPWSDYLLTPQGDEFEWPYHQHAAEITGSGSLILFDNGNFRAIPPEPKAAVEASYSRAVEYQIDPQAKTVRQIWSYGGPQQEVFFSPFISEADQLPETGNILITDGGRIRDEQGNQSDQIVGGEHWARILEVTHAAQPEKVFELVIDSGLDESIGWAVYRSERLPSLYSE